MKIFEEIVENIRSIGLKKPITVTEREGSDGAPAFLLVCGEGRLNAFRLLGERHIPALVVNVSDEDAFIMSLAENIARRGHRPLEILADIELLLAWDYTIDDIIQRTGLSQKYVRDIVFLLATRWMFRKLVFHFHAGGVSGYASELPSLLRPLFRAAYRKPDLAIRTAPQNPDDGAVFGAGRNVVVPNGVEDMRGKVPEHRAGGGEPLTILFTGVMTETKGVMVVLEAFDRVVKEGMDARLEMMGKWSSEAFQVRCAAFVRDHGLGDRVSFIGVLSGREKFERFAACDIFCFPSFYEAETFGLVLLEAMQFAKPVVSSIWRGIPSVVADGRSGYLVPIRQPEEVAARLLTLRDPELRRSMGEEGRRIFELEFTLKAFHHNMEREFIALFQ